MHGQKNIKWRYHHVNTSEFSVSSINMAENKVDRNVLVFAVQFVGFVRS
jgi:hypothetical protein